MTVVPISPSDILLNGRVDALAPDLTMTEGPAAIAAGELSEKDGGRGHLDAAGGWYFHPHTGAPTLGPA